MGPRRRSHHRLRRSSLPGRLAVSTLNYLVSSSLTAWENKLERFVPDKFFRASLIFWGKAKAYTKRAPSKNDHKTNHVEQLSSGTQQDFWPT